MAQSAAPHLADRHVAIVHAGDRADEAGIAHVDEGDFAIRLADDQHGVVLQLPIDGVVQHPAVIQRAIGGGRIHHGEAGTMEQSRE